jgi:hypothetical protein
MLPVTSSPIFGSGTRPLDETNGDDPHAADQKNEQDADCTADNGGGASANHIMELMPDSAIPHGIALQLFNARSQNQPPIASAGGGACVGQTKAARGDPAGGDGPKGARGQSPAAGGRQAGTAAAYDQLGDGQTGNGSRYPGTQYADASTGTGTVMSAEGGGGDVLPLCPKPATTVPSSHYGEMRSLSATEGFFAFNPVGRFAKGAAGAAYDAWTALPRALVGLGNLARDAVGYADHAIDPQRSVVTGEAFPYQPKSGLIQSIQQKGVAGTLGDGITSAVRNAPAIGLVGALYAPNRDWANVGAQTLNTVVAGVGAEVTGVAPDIPSAWTVTTADIAAGMRYEASQAAPDVTKTLQAIAQANGGKLLGLGNSFDLALDSRIP